MGVDVNGWKGGSMGGRCQSIGLAEGFTCVRRKPGDEREGRICHLPELSDCTVDIRVLNVIYD
eukprot:4813752-Ditylum_brightwellii.AAC.1